MEHQDLNIRQMRREELDQLVDWAATEGWNPGLSDAEVFWNTDPKGFIAAEVDGRMAGGGSIVSYSGQYGFMGFFIMHPEFRGRGLGNRLWQRRLQLLRGRLDKHAAIGMDGVFDMQNYYARGGFRFAGRDLRYQGVGVASAVPAHVVDLEQLPFSEISAYDRAHFPAPRSSFLKRWIVQPGVVSRAVISNSKLAGFGVMRPCREGHKIGPLFADDAVLANDLFQALAGQATGEPVFLDVPEANAGALELAAHHGMSEVFGCAKMYFGPAPVLPETEIFGVSSFELG